MVCKECLGDILTRKPEGAGRQFLKRSALWGLSVVSFLLAWSFFVLVGRLMILLRDLRGGAGG